MNLTKEIYILKNGNIFSGPFFAKQTKKVEDMPYSPIEYDISEIEKECERLDKLEPSDIKWLPTYSYRINKLFRSGLWVSQFALEANRRRFESYLRSMKM